MGLLTLFITAVGLSMDACAVAICKGLSVRTVKMRHMLITGLWFGGFQALMPLIGYLLGSISAGVLISKNLAKTDIRTQGSGNAGTTNMLRILGRRLALLTFVGDIVKGVIRVFDGCLFARNECRYGTDAHKKCQKKSRVSLDGFEHGF